MEDARQFPYRLKSVRVSLPKTMKNISQQLGNFENYQDLLDSIIYFMRLEGVERTEICTLLGYSTRTMARRFNGEKIFAYPEMAKILEHLKLPEISEKGYYVLIGAGRQQHIPSTTTEKQSEVYLQSIDDLIAKSEILPQELSNEIKSLVETAKQNHLFSGSKESLDEYASLKKIQIYLERQSQK